LLSFERNCKKSGKKFGVLSLFVYICRRNLK
jgi:hypothetical protein